MHVGVLTVSLFLGESASLKDKRHVVKSLVEAVRHRFNVAIAEVDDQDLWQRATLGIACVSNDHGHANSILDRVLDFMESNRFASVIGTELEILAI
jgi:uncharacterized protein YlxP (DUF503 family)